MTTGVIDSELRGRLARDGHAMVERAINAGTIADLKAALVEDVPGDSRRARGGSTYALRNVLSRVPRVAELIRSAEVRDLVETIIGDQAFAARGILFDKTRDANWKVAWHQDLSIEVKRRIEVPGYGPWSVKASVQHVQPPAEVLQRMLTLRIHLDDCCESNGPLRVIPGSHARGILGAPEVEELSRTRPQVACTGRAGSVLLMSPLILHASSSAVAVGHRRVLHIEFAAHDLPGGLEWLERVSVRSCP